MMRHKSSTRLVAMFAVGLIAATVAILLGASGYSPVIGWVAAAATYVIWVWSTIGGMDAAATKSHATVEDPSRGTVELLVILASIASLAAVAVVLVQSHSGSGPAKVTLAAISVLSVALSWGLVHTLFTLRYASLYYREENGGINFNQAEPPQYSDFAYLAFTVGMTFQVSDTNLETHAVRVSVLRHALLSFMFGSVILATLINLVAGL